MLTLIKIANFFIYPIVKLYWRIFCPKTTGVKVFIQYTDKVLFIKNSYGSGYWTLPGGGVKKNENPENAARREVQEEVDITLSSLVSKGSFMYTEEGKKDTIWVFFARVNNDSIRLDNFEIQDASWENISSLTLTQSPIAKKCFELVGYQMSSS